MQNTQPKMQNFRSIFSEYHWLDLVESISIAASAVGTVFGALSGQVVFAAAPLTVALSLNLANRYRLDETTEQYTKAAISDVRNVVESLYTSFPETDENHMDLENLQASIVHLQQVTERLENKALTEDDWRMVNVRFLTLQESLERLTQSISNPQLTASDRPISEESESLNDASSKENIESHYWELQERITKLEKNNQGIIKPYLERLTQKAESLANVRNKLQEIGEEIQQRTVVQEEVNLLTQQLQTLAEEQAQLNQQFLDLSQSTEPVNLSGIEAAIARVSQDLSATKTQTTKRFKGIVRSLHPLEAQIKQLQQLCEKLQSSVEKVTEDMDEMSDASNLENLENILNQVSAELAEVQYKIIDFPTPFNPAPFEHKLEELTALVKQKSLQPTQFLTKQDIAPLVSAIKKLQKRK